MAEETAASPVLSSDEQRLHELGYAQELRRHMSGFTNFAVSFTIISILSGCLTLYGTAMNTGGPAVITWGVVCVAPTLLRLRQGRAFKPGPWQLGRWSRPVGILAVAWVAFITVLFMLPTGNPVGWSNFNYTVVALVAVIGFAGIWWLLSARRWFTGPRVQGTPEELAAIEAELESLA